MLRDVERAERAAERAASSAFRWVLSLAATVLIALAGTAWGQPEAPNGPAVSASAAPSATATPSASAVPSARRPSASADQLRTCLSSFTSAQRLRRNGALLEARDALVRCAADTCPAVVQSRCVQWLVEVRGEIPSVVVEITGRDGGAVLDAEVRIDERLQLLDGRAIELDPGPHLLQVTLPDGGSEERVFEALQGQRNQPLAVSFAPAKPDVRLPTAETGPWAIAGYVGFAVGGVGLLAGAITGGLALSDGSELDEQCDAEGCTQSEIDRGLALAHTSTATFLVGGLGITLGIIGVVVDAEGRDRDASTGPPAVSARFGPTSAHLIVRF